MSYFGWHPIPERPVAVWCRYCNNYAWETVPYRYGDNPWVVCSTCYEERVLGYRRDCNSIKLTRTPEQRNRRNRLRKKRYRENKRIKEETLVKV